MQEAQVVNIASSLAIKESGVSTLSKDPRVTDVRSAVIAVWSSDFEPWIGCNPLVELK